MCACFVRRPDALSSNSPAVSWVLLGWRLDAQLPRRSMYPGAKVYVAMVTAPGGLTIGWNRGE
ncbi:hypothetical protein FE257_005305 [Aspergillus nanangensis]|uniref:Uncharacterized protein n=1 Tax=Aspergillus nanangensis TaxID=2582783 RepID=A0AAD4CAB9_ASPNN|nr:hypothetical protein FE257_005305 [Aspergillus nanangensis]